jgi:four helix bundle protein
MLDYERLDVYQCAIKHLALVFAWIPRLPRGYSTVADQWRRAAMSIPLNIAEGVGKTTPADRAGRFTIARGEAMECGALIDIVRLVSTIPSAELDTGKELIVRVVSMLTRLCV